MNHYLFYKALLILFITMAANSFVFAEELYNNEFGDEGYACSAYPYDNCVITDDFDQKIIKSANGPYYNHDGYVIHDGYENADNAGFYHEEDFVANH